MERWWSNKSADCRKKKSNPPVYRPGGFGVATSQAINIVREGGLYNPKEGIMKAIDFANPGDVRKIDLVDVYEQLSVLRENPEEFQKAADSLKRAFITQLSVDSRQQSSLEKLQKEIDVVVKKAPSALQGAA